MGSKFRVVVADLEMLKEIMVKQHDKLPYRGIISVSLVCTLYVDFHVPRVAGALSMTWITVARALT